MPLGVLPAGDAWAMIAVAADHRLALRRWRPRRRGGFDRGDVGTLGKVVFSLQEQEDVDKDPNEKDPVPARCWIFWIKDERMGMM